MTLTRLQQASKNAAQMKRSEAARKAAATRKQKRHEAALNAEAEQVDAMLSQMAHEPLEAVRASRCDNTMFLLLQAMEHTYRIAPLLSTTGIEFVIVGTNGDPIPPSRLADSLHAIGKYIAEQARQFTRDYLDSTGMDC